MIPAGRITSIWRYPVKSMLGEQLTAAEIGELGLHADRTWAVRDVELDATTSAKRLPGLLWCTARYAQTPPPDAGPGQAPEVVITFPDGAEVASSDPAVHQVLSRYLDREVELRPLPPIDRRDQYRGPLATKTDLRTIFGLEDDEPLPDLSMFPVRKLAEISRYTTPVGSYVDAYPVHVITEQSLATVAALAPDSDFDVRRFRPTIVVDSPSASAHPEWDWCGGRLRAPHAELQPLIPTIRCVMPSHEQPELKRDKEITRTIAAHSRRCLGVYGTVTRAGRIVEGDVLQLDPSNRTAIGSTAGSGATKVKRAVMRAVSAAMPTGKRS
jgi:uncharacterized protein